VVGNICNDVGITVVPAVGNLEDCRGCLGEHWVTQADNQRWNGLEGTGKHALLTAIATCARES